MILVNDIELPEWYKPKDNIKTGYRKIMTPYNTFLSMFQWHNETLNIHTHLLFGLYMLYTFYGIIQYADLSTVSMESMYLIYSVYINSALMGIFSGITHTFYIISKDYNTIFLKLDFTGIILINYSHCLFNIFVFFKCILKNIFLCRLFFLIHTVISAICIFRIWKLNIEIGRYWARAYPVLSSFAVTIPLYIYSRMTITDSEILELTSNSLECTKYILVAGIIFFKGQFPEYYFNPWNIFDYFNSHVWHHIFINISILAAFKSLSILYKM